MREAPAPSRLAKSYDAKSNENDKPLEKKGMVCLGMVF